MESKENPVLLINCQDRQDNEIASDISLTNVTLSEIANKMKQIGDKHASKAEETENMRTAKEHFNLAERAYSMTLRALNQIQKSNSDLSYDTKFLDLVFSGGKGRVHRSNLWQLYCEYCDHLDEPRMKKQAFFERVLGLGFELVKTGDFYFIPKNGSRSEEIFLSRKLIGLD